MRRSLFVSLLCMGLALVAIPLGWMRVDGEKEDVAIWEETLSGDLEAASGITVQVASHWNGRLLWNTEYTVGDSGEARSDLTFSSKRVEWEREARRAARMDFVYGTEFGTGEGDQYKGISLESMPCLPYPEAVQAVAGRAGAAGKYAETVRIGEYYEYYPVFFEISGISVTYQGDYGDETVFLTELFHIGTAQDCLELQLEKRGAGAVTSLSGQKVGRPGDIMIADASAFGKAGAYYAFSCADAETGARVDRGENAGIFYLPFEQEKYGICVDLGQMKKVCDLPEDTAPAEMLLDEERGCLYMAARGRNDYELLVYSLDQGKPALTQQVALGQGRLCRTEDGEEEGIYLADTDVALEPAPTTFCAMSREEGGLLMTWSDNGFSFMTEEDGEYGLWCSGQFPEQPEEEYVGTGGGGWVCNHMFPIESACLFDGERLVLAAFEDWDSLNVLLAVYDRDGNLYSGRCLQNEEPVIEPWDKILPQGKEHETWLWGRLTDEYGSMEPEGVRPLELIGK